MRLKVSGSLGERRRAVLSAVVYTATELPAIGWSNSDRSGVSRGSVGCSASAGENAAFPKANADDEATRKPRRSIFMVEGVRDDGHYGIRVDCEQVIFALHSRRPHATLMTTLPVARPASE